MTRAEIHTDGRKICDANLTFKTMPFPSEELKRLIAERARDIGLVAGTLGQ